MKNALLREQHSLTEFLLQFIQQPHGLNGCQRIRLAAADGVQHLALAHGVQRDLIGLFSGGHVLYTVFILQLLQNDLSPLDHLLRQTRQLGDFDAVAAVGAAGDDLPQEDDILPPALDGDVVGQPYMYGITRLVL